MQPKPNHRTGNIVISTQQRDAHDVGMNDFMVVTVREDDNHIK